MVETIRNRWDYFLSSFLFPALMTFLVGGLIAANLRWIEHGTILNLVIWIVCYFFSLANLINLLPFLPLSGGKMTWEILVSVSGKFVLWLSILLGIVSLATFWFFSGSIIATLTCLIFYYFGTKRYLKNEAEGFKFRMQFWKSVIAMALYLFLLIGSLGFFFIVSSKLGALSLPSSSGFFNRLIFSDGFRDVRGQIHVHCYRSHDSRGTLEEIAGAAKSSGIEWVILTDHISSSFPYENPKNLDGVLFIFGKEGNWKKQGSYFLAPVGATYQQLRAYGHMEQYSGLIADWDAVEIVNLHGNSFRRPDNLLKQIFSDPIHSYHGLIFAFEDNFRHWQTFSENKGRPMPIFAGPDSHANIWIFGVPLDPYEATLKIVSTHIFLPEGEELNETTIIRAVKDGRTYVCFDCLGDSLGFQFFAAKNKKRFIAGSTVIKPDRLGVLNPEAEHSKIRIFRNNALISETANESYIEIVNPDEGFWRAEIYKNDLLWIISGQILVKH